MTGGANGSSAGGATLVGSGSSSVGADDMTLSATGLAPSEPGLYFQGDNAINGGAGNPFGDGLRCAGGEIKRLEICWSQAAGINAEVSTSISIAELGGVEIGETKRYQYWYRDPDVWICDNGFNLTKGYEVTWTY